MLVVLDEQRHRRRRHALGGRGNVEERVRGAGHGRVKAGQAERARLDTLVARDSNGEAGSLILGDERLGAGLEIVGEKVVYT